jgi:hypothetical protein
LINNIVEDVVSTADVDEFRDRAAKPRTQLEGGGGYSSAMHVVISGATAVPVESALFLFR